ncbi:MAG: hypothetical protein ACOY3P_06430 [Planctomycetota bacterium]
MRARWARLAAVGFTVEMGLASVGVLVSTLGLFGVAPLLAAAGSVIVVALGLLVASWFRRFAVKARTRASGMAEVGAITTEYLAGGPGVVLGILAAAGIVPTTLCAVAVLLFGVMLMFGGTEVSRQANLSTMYPPPHPPDPRTLRVLLLVAGVQMIVGIAAVILGIMALVGIRPVPLVLLALLGMSVSKALGAATVAWRMRMAT